MDIIFFADRNANEPIKIYMVTMRIISFHHAIFTHCCHISVCCLDRPLLFRARDSILCCLRTCYMFCCPAWCSEVSLASHDLRWRQCTFHTQREIKQGHPAFVYSRLQRGICFCTALSLWLLFQDLTLVRLYSNTQKLFTWIIPRLTHFPRFSFNGGQLKRLCITEMIEETRI